LQKEEVEVRSLVEDIQQIMTEEFHDKGVELNRYAVVFLLPLFVGVVL
jgi:hypothetical protein